MTNCPSFVILLKKKHAKCYISFKKLDDIALRNLNTCDYLSYSKVTPINIISNKKTKTHTITE